VTDPNETAHRIVREATGGGDDPPPCPECGQPMERREGGGRTGGRFGTDRSDLHYPETYLMCPNGHEVRSS